jgi:hypothetical protein
VLVPSVHGSASHGWPAGVHAEGDIGHALDTFEVGVRAWSPEVAAVIGRVESKNRERPMSRKIAKIQATRSRSKKVKFLATKTGPIELKGDIRLKGSELVLRGPIAIASGAVVTFKPSE